MSHAHLAAVPSLRPTRPALWAAALALCLALLIAPTAPAQSPGSPDAPASSSQNQDASQSSQTPQADEDRPVTGVLHDWFTGPQAPKSPRAAVMGFEKEMRDLQSRRHRSWDRAMTYIDKAAFADPDSQEARQRVAELWQVLVRLRAIDPAALPGPGQLDSQQDYVYFPRPDSQEDQQLAERLGADARVGLTRDSKGLWRFSARTLEGVPALLRALDRAGVQPKQPVDPAALDTSEPMLRRWSPAWLKGEARTWLELEYWQWASVGVLIFIGLALDLIVRLAVGSVVTVVIKRRTGEAPSSQILRGRMRPIGLTAAALVWVALLQFVDLPGMVETIAFAAARVFVTLTLTWSGWCLVDVLRDFLLHYSRRTATRLDDVLVPLLSKTLKIFIIAMGVIYVADSLHIPIGPLLASLGIGGLAFAFAAKDTIENFFGSVSVLLDRSFDVGDWVQIGEHEGIVEEVGFRSTRIRTFYNSQIIMPNAMLVRAAVDNYGRRRYRRWRTMIGVQYDTTPDQLVAFTEGIREMIRLHPLTRKDFFQVALNEFGDSSLQIIMNVFFETPDWSTELRERERLFLDIVRLADQLGVQFAFPTTTVHLFREKHEPYHTKHAAPQSMTDRRAMVSGIRAAQTLVGQQKWRDEKPEPVTFQQGPTQLEDDEDDKGKTELTEDRTKS